MAVNVIKPGLSTTVQDLGRFGWQQYGVPVSCTAMPSHTAGIISDAVDRAVKRRPPTIGTRKL